MVRLLAIWLLVLGGSAWADELRELRDSDGRCLDATAQRIALRSCQGLPSQHWRLTEVADGRVRLSTEASAELCLAIADDGAAALQLAPCADAAGQRWRSVRRTPRAIRLIAPGPDAARDDGRCLARVDRKPQVAPCADGNNAWTVVEAEATTTANAEPDGFDGEIRSDHALGVDFVLQFDATCALAIPREPRKAVRVFRCRRAEADVQCVVRSATSLAEVFSTLRSLRVLRAPVSLDTRRALAFATPAGKLAFTVDLKAGTATLAQPDLATCKGRYHPRDAWLAMAQQYRAEHPAAKADDPDEPAADEPARPTAAPAPARDRPKGLAHGRMCGRSSECASGVCKMQNSHRGTCQ